MFKPVQRRQYLVFKSIHAAIYSSDITNKSLLSGTAYSTVKQVRNLAVEALRVKDSISEDTSTVDDQNNADGNNESDQNNEQDGCLQRLPNGVL